MTDLHRTRRSGVDENISFKPVKTKRAFEDVCDQIRLVIQEGRLEAAGKRS